MSIENNKLSLYLTLHTKERQSMIQEIGSNFWLNPEEKFDRSCQIDLTEFGITGSDSIFLSTGRAAENMALDEVERRNPHVKKVALIPPFTCHTVIEPFIKHGYTLCAYPINAKDLSTTADMLRDAVEASNAEIVLVHRLFGFDTLPGCGEVIQEYSKKGVIFIEDQTQSLFSGWAPFPVDYITGSLRKWMGMPDGGYIFCREGILPEKPDMYDKELTEAKVKASFEKYEFLFNHTGAKRNFLDAYRKAEDILDREKRYYKISPVSENVFCSTDLNELKTRRRENYRVLYEELPEISGRYPLTGKPDDNAVPLYYAMWVEDRMGLQSWLGERNIYAPIVWPKAVTAPLVCKEAESIYDHILCIPVDQRYGTEEMKWIAECINGYER